MPKPFWTILMSQQKKSADYIQDGLIYQGLPLGQSNATSISLPDGVFTVEVVNELIAEHGTAGSYRVLLRMFNNSPGEYLNQLGNLNNAGTFLYYINNDNWVITPSNLPVTYNTIGDKRTTSFTLDSDMLRSVYCNGNLQVQALRTKAPARTDYNNVYAESNGVYYNYFDVRIYDRVLTAEEIAHNYTIDKERFGI